MKDDAWTALLLALVVALPDEFTLKDWDEALEKERVNECEFCKTEGSEVCLNKGDYNICELCFVWEDLHKKCSYYERAAYCRRCGRKLEEAHVEAME